MAIEEGGKVVALAPEDRAAGAGPEGGGGNVGVRRFAVPPRGGAAAEEYLVGEVAGVYRAQGVDLDTRTDVLAANAAALAGGGVPATAREVVLGITRAALATDSFLAAASFRRRRACSPTRRWRGESTACAA